MHEIYPWQMQQWQRWENALQQNKLGHAYLIYGVAGLGKLHLTQVFSQFINCHSDKKFQQQKPCNQCKNCTLYISDSHPDVYKLPPECNQTIKINDIKNLRENIQNSPQFGEYKLVIFAPAEAMTTSAANALLKILEEPPKKTIFFLISSNIAMLSATIRSRCQMISLQPPNIEMTKTFLNNQNVEYNEQLFDCLNNITQGAPLRLLYYLTEKSLLSELISDLHKYPNESLDLTTALKKYFDIDALDFIVALQWFIFEKLKSQQVDLKILHLLDELNNDKQALMSQISLNKNLLIENYLLKIMEFENAD